MTGHLAVETERLTRVHTARGGGRASTMVVLDEVTLSVRRGELFGVIGVNGAGKTTLLQILATQLRPTSGTARVAGFDVCRYAAHVRQHVGVVCLDEGPTVRLRAPALSSGQRQRRSVERGCAARPKVLLLDQPTLGLDCVASREVRGFIRQWMREDETRTVVLATNDMGEANELCDRVAILDAGRMVTCDTPAALKDRWHPQPSAPDTPAHEAAAFEAAFLAVVGRQGWAAV